jgi:hypothetical protein
MYIGVANNFKIDSCLHQFGSVFSLQKQIVDFGVNFFCVIYLNVIIF